MGTAIAWGVLVLCALAVIIRVVTGEIEHRRRGPVRDYAAEEFGTNTAEDLHEEPKAW